MTQQFEKAMEECGFVPVTSPDAKPKREPICCHCHDQGEIFTGRYSDQGYWQPPEPIMEPCPHCEEVHNESAEEKH